ncbi:ImmA/IrrE family metallo-endopeptidase [Gordonia humi]|uniref:IrrE N-terminal-like domain-containing protein n=1 Tax=Gordonia humi TaxID=686429 RepID=A0A840FCX7_9ACTN|nr:ImmA/IrrE family metallo-endopeptidase [Gordonia humi]MBB4137970.1 hypothetical protein [Gordonia humi]
MADRDYAIAKKLVDGLPMHRPWSITALIAQLSLDNDRPIVVAPLPDDLAPYCTAAWLGEDALDRIYVSDRLTEVQREVAIAHELGHILLAHELSHADRTSYLQQMFPAIPERFLAAIFGTPCTPLTRSNYDHPYERQAEWFARLLISRADEYRSNLLPDGRKATLRQQRILDRAATVFGWP